MRFNKLAVPTGDPTAPWTAIYNTLRGIQLSGHAEAVPVNVDVLERQEAGCYFAWLETAGTLKYVLPSATSVAVALGNARASNPALGRIVPVRITDPATMLGYGAAVENALRKAA
jgi:hypothetical protein